MNPSSSAMDWFVLCSVSSVHDTRNIFIYIYRIYFQMHLCVLLCFDSGSTFRIRIMCQMEIRMFILFITSFCY